ncbi:hypothetical protein L596_013979 [Steinernema carpocapsae]|uniref:G-protein coupled receptors family 1 profile domain-containing protein n=1 Tax=Steinernema carpocapsae TaxID=34508 RepID=A0A4U5NAU4_STECR|nr:hypothetical protein L596_013979 [Steinernema carpocapsae]
MDAPDHAPVQNTTTLYYLLPGPAYIEFGLNLIGPLPNLYFLCLLKRPFFHLNLRILLAHLSITLILLNISRLLSLVDAWGNFLSDTAEYIITCVNESFVYIIINSANLMCAERIFATVLVERYERVRRWWITVVSITVTIFIILGQCNQRRWKGALQKKLSHKYQILENIRTARQLLIVLLLAFFTSLYYYISVMYILLNRDSGTVARVLIQMFDLSVSVFSVFLPCIFIKTHPRMNAVAKRHLKRNLHLSRLCPAPTPRMQKRSVSVVVEEANMYFSDLQKSWSNAGRRK